MNSNAETGAMAVDHGKRRRLKRWSPWLWWAYDTYAIIVLVHLLASQWRGDAIWPITVLAYVFILVLPIAFLLLPLALYRRRWLGASLQALCAIAFLWVVIDTRAENRTSEAPPGSIEVSALTYNIGDGLAPPERLIPMLAEADADIVALVEVTDDVAAAINAAGDDFYPYRVVRGAGISGKGLLSRYPVTDYEWLEYNPGRPDLRVQLDISGNDVTVIVAHPPPPEITRTGVEDREGTEAQLNALRRLVAGRQGPLLLLGDFNITRQHDVYTEIESAGLQDVFHIAGSGFGFTIPARLQALRVVSDRLAAVRIVPVARIDYIWASEHWLPLDAWVAADAGSDHLPVMARLALLPAAP